MKKRSKLKRKNILLWVGSCTQVFFPIRNYFCFVLLLVLSAEITTNKVHKLQAQLCLDIGPLPSRSFLAMQSPALHYLICTKAKERLPIFHSRLQTSNWLQTSYVGLQSSGVWRRTSEFRIQSSEFWLQTSHFGIWASDLGLLNLGRYSHTLHIRAI